MCNLHILSNILNVCCTQSLFSTYVLYKQYLEYRYKTTGTGKQSGVAEILAELMEATEKHWGVVKKYQEPNT